MTGRSLRLRLLVASALSIAAALAISGFGLGMLFDRHVERRARAELATFVQQIAAGVAIADDGALSLSRPLADPRFEQVFSGLYWQVSEDGQGAVLRSRSLWDHVLPLNPDALPPGQLHSHILPGPRGEPLLVEEQVVIFRGAAGGRPLRIAAALERREIDAATGQFAGDMVPALALLALVLIAAAWLQVTVGLRPLEAVRQGVTAIRERRRRRLEGRFPDEVMPLVSEVNDLLEAQDSALERARARAGDLAHGLKTPLTVLAADARKLRGRGEAEIAGELEELARAMQHHVERELARSRIAQRGGGAGQAAELDRVVGGLVAALRRTPRGEALDWELDIPTSLAAAVDPADLAEVAGNLVDNAMKWARGSVSVAARREGGQAVLSVRDDGAGVPDEMLATLGRRGTRLDEGTPGSGLGLAIAREIAEAYGGSLVLANDPRGGMVATVRFPAAG